MFSPIRTLFIYFPLRAYATVLVMCAISLFVFAYLQKQWESGTISRTRCAAIWLLTAYTMFLLFFTVLGRRSLDYYRYNFDIGYSYLDVFYTGNPEMVSQIAVNIAMFVPVGLLAALSTERFRFPKALLFGIMLTATVEFLQLMLRNGTCEIDDLISNTLGTLAGSFLIEAYHYIKRRFL